MTAIAEIAQRRAAVVRAIHDYFDHEGFLEVDTPVALTTVAPELNIEAPAVKLQAGGKTQRRFLQTSPELPMKRLLAAGLDRIYQIAPVFRDGDLGPQHRPEFRLLEWYRRGASWEALLADCQGLLRACAHSVGHGDQLATRGTTVELAADFRRLTVEEAFVSFAGFSILEALTLESLRPRAREAEVAFAENDDWDDLFHRVFLNRVEPELAKDPRPVFLTQFPAPLASLARLSPTDRRTSERFELYVAGVELANGFGELTDATEQRRRFERERDRRAERGLRDYPLDERFLTALDELPAAAGIALGLERLLMLLLDQDLDSVTLIPWSAT